jgi:predicted adenine nucleotide alpha hydrolase (AANH) superfamily ATPase
MVQFYILEKAIKIFLGIKIVATQKNVKRKSGAIKMGNNNYKAPNIDDMFVKSLIEQRDKALQDDYKKINQYLYGIGYYNLEYADRVKYLTEPDGLVLIENASSKKISFPMFSSLFSMTQKQFYDLMRETPEIFDAIERGRSKSVDEIELALEKIAKGYTVWERYEQKSTDARGREMVQESKRERHFQPNYLANRYLLETRRKLEYEREKTEMEMERNKVNLEIVIVGEDEIVVE